jgi:hypothetical protein
MSHNVTEGEEIHPDPCCRSQRCTAATPSVMTETDLELEKAENRPTARQAMTDLCLELRARKSAWFRCAGDS